jgi:hypothetical protein
MSILTSIAAAQTRPQQTQTRQNSLFGGNNGQNQDRVEAQIWLNVGYEVEVEPGVKRFINLPLGLAIDTMQEMPERGQNADWLALVKARNAFLRTIQKLSQDLAPGQEEYLPEEIVLKIRRIDNKVVIEDNPLVLDLEGIWKKRAEENQRKAEEARIAAEAEAEAQRLQAEKEAAQQGGIPPLSLGKKQKSPDAA